jgi:ATP-dependent protease HslVU (ClpYQ) peptidase subunit
MELEFATQLARVDQRSQQNEERIGKLEHDNEVLHELATSVSVMASKLEGMTSSINTLTDKVCVLEAEPAKKWRFVVEKAIYVVVAAVVGFVLARVGL